MFYYLREGYVIKTIVMGRAVNDQAASHADIHRKPYNKKLISQKVLEIEKWKKFSEKIRKKYPLDYHYVDFLDIITQPIETYKKVNAFIEETIIYPSKILQWIDPKLVHFRSDKALYNPVTKD